MNSSRARRVGTRIGSIGILILLWAIIAAIAQSSALPSPWQVVQALWRECSNGEIFFHIAMTLWRVIAAFMIAMVIGSAVGIAMGRSKMLNQWIDDWLIVLLNIPALVTIILAYVWFGLNEVAAIGAVAVNKIPNVIVTLREGTRALAPQYDELARVYRFGRTKTLRHIILPQLTPYFFAAARGGIALIWKIVLVVELLGRSNGVGFQLHLFFQMFDIASILAYTVAFVAVMLIVETWIIAPLDRRLNRWKA